MTRAVFAGINLYKNYCTPPNDDSLRGCVNDSRHLQLKAFNDWDIPQKDIVVLHDFYSTAEAEKAAVLSMIRGQSGESKNLYWGHSSHGSNNPAPLSQQKDGLEELLCCYDLEEGTGSFWVSGYISASWIGIIIAQVRPKDTLDIFLDCCNAPEGSQLKRIARTYSKARFIPRSISNITVKPKTVVQVQATIPKNVALWSACEPQQTSADAYIDREWQGAFTTAFLKAAKKGRTRVGIISEARDWLRSYGYNQTCHLYCGKEMAQATIKK
jgi:hypothetical protein